MGKKKISLFRIFLLRHGETPYNGKFPDHTREGVFTILRTSLRLRRMIRANEDVVLVSSMTPRTQGAGSIIAHALGRGDRVIRSKTLRQMEVRDQRRAKEIFQEYLEIGGTNALDLSYTHDDRYNDPVVFEPREQVAKRLLTCFVRRMSEFFESGLVGGERRRPCFIAVSHFEVLYWFVESLFELDYSRGDKPLGHGELIEVSFWYRGNKKEIWMDVAFRGKTLSGVPFNYTELL